MAETKQFIMVESGHRFHNNNNAAKLLYAVRDMETKLSKYVKISEDNNGMFLF